MKKSFLGFLILLSLGVQAECVHEVQTTGSKLYKFQGLKSQGVQVYVENNGIYSKLEKIKSIKGNKSYNLQLVHEKSLNGYDDRYLKYYRYARINTFLSQMQPIFEARGYAIKVIGQSVEGRNLYAVYPKEISNTKKTLVMLGRQHGDEGTQNWIIEGFIRKLFSDDNADWFNNYQLMFYPMVNPDGAENHVRYNKNGRDLNRSWHANPDREFDEIVTIHGHLRKYWDKFKNNIFAFLDMHGSFTEDFIYRVGVNFRGRSFYNIQQDFIDELGKYDPWQNANFELSSGSPTMARIVMVKAFGINALTHETPRDIEINNSRGRSIKTLNEQGEAILQTIHNLY